MDEAREVLQVTYADGSVERFPDATETRVPNQSPGLLELLKGKRGGGQLIDATRVLANVRKWNWIVEQDGDGRG